MCVCVQAVKDTDALAAQTRNALILETVIILVVSVVVTNVATNILTQIFLEVRLFQIFPHVPNVATSLLIQIFLEVFAHARRKGVAWRACSDAGASVLSCSCFSEEHACMLHTTQNVYISSKKR